MLFNLLLSALLLATPQQQLADRVVAVVNGDPILFSEIHMSMPVETIDKEQFEDLYRNNLESRIDQLLILQEIKRLRVVTVRPEEVESIFSRIVAEYGSVDTLSADLAKTGMTILELQTQIRRELMILKFIDYRFRRFVNVTDEEISEYYEEEYLPAFRTENPGADIPDIASQRDPIALLIRERKINDALDNWLDNMRASSQIVIKY